MTRGRKRKADGKPTSDIISVLPKNVIECILEHLPIRDAVRTSILSRKWRYNWISIHQLVFEYQFFGDTVEDKALREYDQSMAIINNVLLLHSGPILKFVLHIPNFPFDPIPAEIDQWILFLSRNGIKELTLDNSYYAPYKLPSCIFSCQGLTHLKLRCCVFRPPPAFKGFRNLISLDLEQITFSTKTFETIISSSPLLDRLKLVVCRGIVHLNIHAPNLKNLDIETELKSICFKHTPNLTDVSIRSNTIEENSQHRKVSNLIEFLGALPKIEKLFLGNHYLKSLAAGGVPDRLPTPANQLNILTLSSLDFNDIDLISSALCLIRSSPNLQELEICASSYADAVVEPALNFLEVQDCREYTLEQLQIVKLNFIMGLRPELELIKILLARSPALEKMFIERDVSIDKNAELYMTIELMRFRRASSKAEIIYLEPEE